MRQRQRWRALPLRHGPAVQEANEIWLPFTSDAEGASGVVEVTSDQRAGAKAVAIVIHDPDNPAKRIGASTSMPSIRAHLCLGLR